MLDWLIDLVLNVGFVLFIGITVGLLLSALISLPIFLFKNFLNKFKSGGQVL